MICYRFIMAANTAKRIPNFLKSTKVFIFRQITDVNMNCVPLLWLFLPIYEKYGSFLLVYRIYVGCNNSAKWKSIQSEFDISANLVNSYNITWKKKLQRSEWDKIQHQKKIRERKNFCEFCSFVDNILIS